LEDYIYLKLIRILNRSILSNTYFPVTQEEKDIIVGVTQYSFPLPNLQFMFLILVLYRNIIPAHKGNFKCRIFHIYNLFVISFVLPDFFNFSKILKLLSVIVTDGNWEERKGKSINIILIITRNQLKEKKVNKEDFNLVAIFYIDIHVQSG